MQEGELVGEPHNAGRALPWWRVGETSGC